MVRMADLARHGSPKPKKEKEVEKVDPELPSEEEPELGDFPGLRSLYEDLQRVFSSPHRSAPHTALEEEAGSSSTPEEPVSPSAQPRQEPALPTSTSTPSEPPSAPPSTPSEPPSTPSEPPSASTEHGGGSVGTASQGAQQVDLESLYDRAYQFLSGIVTDVRNGTELSLTEGVQIVAPMISSQAATETFYRKAINLPQNYEQLPSHLVNVAIYAIRIAQGLEYQKEDLFRLGISGLFYDIGLARVPESILKKSGALTEEERKVIYQHPQYGYDILSAALPKAPWLARVALEHHERENGEGYPRRLSGEEIHEYAKVIGLADIYDAATCTRPYRKRKLPFEAVREILRSERGNFPPRVLKVLLVKLSVFPIGSYIQLNSGAIGKVVEVNEVAPLRPKVELLYDSQGKKLLSRKVLDLRQTSILHIESPVEAEKLPDA